LNDKVKKLVRASLLLAIAIIIQILGKNIPEINQFLVGPIVNAILIITAFVCGTWWGIGVGVLTPVIAWLVGQLPGPMAPFIPFIMIGNALFVIFFGILKNQQKWGKYIGLILGSFVKFLFLSFSAAKLITVFNIGIQQKIASKLVIMMGIPQLITALIGSIISLVLIKTLTKRKAY
jgi:predicted membrane protein